MRKTYLATDPLQLANLATASFAQGNLVPQTLDNPRNEPAPVFPIPSDRQRAWQETEFYAFYHYGMNTFRNYQNGGDNEWGYGDEDPLTYAPTELPNCVIWGGTEARWVGNEAGYAPIENWSNQSENGWKWLPTESDAKATTQGWFWNEGEGVLSAERLFQIYLETVGRNATLILNIPPNKYGVLPDATVNSMEALGTRLDNRLTNDLAQSAKVSALCERSGGFYAATCTTDGDKESYWTTDDDITSGATLTFTWAEPQTVHYVMLQEYLPKGQRIKSFLIGTSADGETFTPRATAPCKTVGYKRIVPLDGNTTSYRSGYSVKALRITLIDSRVCPLLHTVSVY